MSCVSAYLPWLMSGLTLIAAAALTGSAQQNLPRDLRKAQSYLSGGLLLLGLGALTQTVPNSLSLVLGGTLSVLGLTAAWRAWLCMARQAPRPVLYAPIALAVLAWVTPPGWSTAALAGSHALVWLGMLWALRNRRASESGPARSGLTTLFLVAAGLELLCLLPDLDAGLRGSVDSAAVTVITRALLPLLMVLVFLLMCVERVQRKLERAAAVDYLTGLLNRRSFAAAGDRAVARARSQVDATRCAVAMVDLDFFKRVNDRFGQATGDRILQHASAHMMEGARQNDLLGRLGGEEFAVLLDDVDEERARSAAERLRRNVEKRPLRLDGESIPVTVSVGVAVLEPTDRDFDDLLRRADRAVLKAKSAGRNRVELAARA